MRVIIACALALMSFSVFAEDPGAETVTLTWDIPDSRMNGDFMPFEEISHYRLVCESQSGDNTAEMEIPSTSDNGAFEGSLSSMFAEYGRYDCEMAVVDIFGLHSNYVVVQNGPIEYLPSRPGVPTNVLILKE